MNFFYPSCRLEQEIKFHNTCHKANYFKGWILLILHFLSDMISPLAFIDCHSLSLFIRVCLGAPQRSTIFPASLRVTGTLACLPQWVNNYGFSDLNNFTKGRFWAWPQVFVLKLKLLLRTGKLLLKSCRCECDCVWLNIAVYPVCPLLTNTILG